MPGPATTLTQSSFPVNFAKFLRTPYLTEHLRWLLLNYVAIYIGSYCDTYHSSLSNACHLNRWSKILLLWKLHLKHSVYQLVIIVAISDSRLYFNFSLVINKLKNDACFDIFFRYLITCVTSSQAFVNNTILEVYSRWISFEVLWISEVKFLTFIHDIGNKHCLECFFFHVIDA